MIGRGTEKLASSVVGWTGETKDWGTKDGYRFDIMVTDY